MSPRYIYLNLFGGAHFYWRSLRACNIPKRTCLSYVWMDIFPWSYCLLKLQIMRLFWPRSLKTIECRFTLKHEKQPPEVFCKKSVPRNRPAALSKKRLWHRCFPVNFAKFLKIPFLTEQLLATASDAYVT